MTSEKQRNSLIDAIRGFAIILVVLGHCIQEGSGASFSVGQLYFQDKVYQFIYSFHMPLLMMVSGYAAYYSISKITTPGQAFRAILNKAAVYLFPAFFWDLFDQIRICILNFQLGYGDVPRIFMRRFVSAFLTHYWYLWAIFLFFCYVLLFRFWKRITIPGYILTFLLMFVTPDGLGFGVYKYLLPFYLMAYHAHQWIAGRRSENGGNESITFANGKDGSEHAVRVLSSRAWNTVCLIGTGVVFLILFLFYDERDFIYLTGYKLLGKNVPEQLMIDAYRFLIGLEGSLFLILCFKVLHKCLTEKYFLWLSYLGRRGLGIYLLSGYATIFFMPSFLLSEQPDYLFAALQSAFVLIVCCIFTEVMRRIPVLRLLVGEGRI